MTDKKLYGEVKPEEELLQSEISAIETEVAKEIERERKAAVKDALREQVRARMRREQGVSEPMETVLIDLPNFADRILLDNVAYLQGMTYTVRASVAETMREVMQNTWEHKSITDGQSENYYRKSRDGQRIMTPAGLVNTTSLLKA